MGKLATVGIEVVVVVDFVVLLVVEAKGPQYLAYLQVL